MTGGLEGWGWVAPVRLAPAREHPAAPRCWRVGYNPGRQDTAGPRPADAGFQLQPRGAAQPAPAILRGSSSSKIRAWVMDYSDFRFLIFGRNVAVPGYYRDHGRASPRQAAAGGSTLRMSNWRVPPGVRQAKVSPSAKPMTAMPIGARIDSRPAAPSACSG